MHSHTAHPVYACETSISQMSLNSHGVGSHFDCTPHEPSTAGVFSLHHVAQETLHAVFTISLNGGLLSCVVFCWVRNIANSQ